METDFITELRNRVNKARLLRDDERGNHALGAFLEGVLLEVERLQGEVEEAHAKLKDA